MQALILDWLQLFAPMVWRLTAATPNAAKRTKWEAYRMKREGLRKGWPDLTIAYPSGEFHGLYVETKTVKGRVEPDQALIHADLRAVGYQVLVPLTFEDAQAGITEYLNL